MRQRYIQIDGKLIPADEVHRVPRETGPAIIGDLEPYQSVITGETISGRAAHRAHLREHGHHEVGDQMPKFLREKYERDGIKPKFDRTGKRIA